MPPVGRPYPAAPCYLRLFPERRVVATLARRIAGGEASEHSQSEEYFTGPHSLPPYLSFAHWLWISACLSVSTIETLNSTELRAAVAPGFAYTFGACLCAEAG